MSQLKNPQQIHCFLYLLGSRKITRAKINRFEEEGGYTLGSEAEAYFVIKDLEYLIASVPSFSEFIN